MSGESKKEYSDSVTRTKLLRLEGKRFMQGVYYFIHNCKINIKEENK
jgi:hypothetical protein